MEDFKKSKNAILTKKYLKDHALGDDRKIVKYLLNDYNPG